jgi:hypothetical protein
MELDGDAASAFARFAADAYGIAIVSKDTGPADRLVGAYRRALLDGAEGAADGEGRYWFEFYMRLEAFVRTALGRMALPYSPETTRALIGFAEILDDDFGRQVRECAFALAAGSALP